jgi:mono/diheme cytochrome c family protein
MLRLTAIVLVAMACQAQETNPLASDPRAAEVGRWSFRIYCAPCHGIHADGSRGPDLTLGTHTAGDIDLFRVISRGVPGTEMAAYGGGRVEDEGIWRLVSYIRSVARHESATIQGHASAGEKVFWGKKFVPKGTVIRTTAHFDNSPNNPQNPDPSEAVRWGQPSRAEMMGFWVDFIDASNR